MYTGERIRLREYRKEDIPLRWSYINDPEIALCLVNETPFPLTLEEEEKWFQTISGLNDTYKFAIETLENNEYIGGCSINHVDWKNSVATVGIFIGNKNYWGKGYGTDAMMVLIDVIFSQMNINKIRLTVYSFNTRAIRSYEKCGMKVEGVLRKEIFRNGEFHDKIAMGILREEYYKIKSKDQR